MKQFNQNCTGMFWCSGNPLSS